MHDVSLVLKKTFYLGFISLMYRNWASTLLKVYCTTNVTVVWCSWSTPQRPLWFTEICDPTRGRVRYQANRSIESFNYYMIYMHDIYNIILSYMIIYIYLLWNLTSCFERGLISENFMRAALKLYFYPILSHWEQSGWFGNNRFPILEAIHVNLENSLQANGL